MSLVREGFVRLPAGPAPGFDHSDMWQRGARMYVAHTGADRIEVIDCRTHAYLRSLDGHPGVAGVLIDQEEDFLFTSDRGAARLSLFRCSDEQLLGEVEVGPSPNGLAYDRRRRRLYAFTVGAPWIASVVDVDELRVITAILLPGRPRWAVYDQERDRIYANIQHPPEVAVIDPARMAIATAFPVPSSGPHGLWLSAGRLFCAADGGALVVLDCKDGGVVTNLPLPGMPDVVMHDPVLHRLYVAINDPGCVYSLDTSRLEHVETVATETGAHTMGWDPLGQSLYVFCPQSSGAALFKERG